MDADTLLWTELSLAGVTAIGDLSDDEVVELGVRYSIWLPESTYVASPWLAPFAIRRARVRTDPHVSGVARDLWGFPDSRGQFTDDNSLIKGAVRGKFVRGSRSPYKTAKLTTGLVCCHVWPSTTGDAQLFSFVPNLVWLPRTLAGFSDAHFRHRPVHDLHYVLQDISVSRYANVEPRVNQRDIAGAWFALPDRRSSVNHAWLENEVHSGDRVSLAAQTRSLKVIHFLSALVAGQVPDRRVSRRYHSGRGPRIDTTVPAIQDFVGSKQLLDLRDRIARSI